MRPILAGRNAPALEVLSDRLGLEHRVFDLDETEAIDHALVDVAAVLHCAGPFLHTYGQMAAACLRTSTHYLDITGEIAVYGALFSLGVEAKEKGVMLLPGIGFDVVPTDCLAAHLERRLPTASRLALAFLSNGPAQISRGTRNTVVEGLGYPSYVRKDGVLTPVQHLSKSRTIDFGDGPIEAQRLTWGDVFTAYHSTGIPNIEGYFVINSMAHGPLRMSRHLQGLLAWSPVKKALKRIIAAGPPGPTDEEREQTHTVVWGQVDDGQGNVATSRLRGPEGYTFTVLTSLAAVRHVLSGEAPSGYQTPSSAFGADFVLEVEGVQREDVA